MKIANAAFVYLMFMASFAYANVDAPLMGSDPQWLTQDMKSGLLEGERVAVGFEAELGSNIQPGAWMFSPNWCTFNYVFKHKATGEYAIGTAGHCTSVGQDVHMMRLVSADDGTSLLESVKVGNTLFSTGSRGVGNDFALVLIDKDKYHLVDPKIRILDGPCGYSTDPIVGKPVVHFGHGLVIGSGGTFRFGVGSPFFNTADSIAWHGTAIYGDSGSPVRISSGTDGVLLDEDSAAAIGVQTHISSAFGIPTPIIKGTSMKRIFEFIPDWELLSSKNCGKSL